MQSDAHRRLSQMPFDDAGVVTNVDLALIWVAKAEHGSTSWPDNPSPFTIKCFYLRKRLKPLRIFAKNALLLLALFEIPSWCDNSTTCVSDNVPRTQLPMLSANVSNSIAMALWSFIAASLLLRYFSLGDARHFGMWHKVGSVATAVAILDCLIAAITPGKYGILPHEGFRLSRVMRPLVYLCFTRALREAFGRIMRTVMYVADVLLALVLCVLFSTWIAVILYSYSGSFKNWGDALASLWILFTTANCPDVFIETYETNKMTFLFFFVYLVASLYLLSNILLSSIYDGYKLELKAMLIRHNQQRKMALKKAYNLLAAEKAIKFEPGKTGITCDGNGVVQQVTPDSQAQGKGITKGDEILKVWSEPFSKDALDHAEESQVKYQITVRAEISKDQWTTFFLHFCGCPVNDGTAAYEFNENRASKVFALLDTDGTSGLSSSEFDYLIDTLEGDQGFVPKRAPPQYYLSQVLTPLLTEGVPIWGFTASWQAIIDTVIGLDVGLTLVQTILFVNTGVENEVSFDNDSRWFWILFGFSCFYFFEVNVNLIVLGIERFWNSKPYRNRFDFLNVYSMFVATLICTQAWAPTWLYRQVVLQHILRAFRLLSYVEPLRFIVSFVIRLSPVYYRLSMALFLVFYVYAMLGMEFFGGQINKTNPSLAGTAYADSNYWSFNFNDFVSSMVLLFLLMIVNNWFIFTGAFMKASHSWLPCIFFVSFFVFCNLVVLNILMALIIDCSGALRDEYESSETEYHYESLLKRVLMDEKDFEEAKEEKTRLNQQPVTTYGSSEEKSPESSHLSQQAGTTYGSSEDKPPETPQDPPPKRGRRATMQFTP